MTISAAAIEDAIEAPAEQSGDSAYHETRFSEEAKRDVVWRTLWDAYFSKRIKPEDSVLDLGAGYGQFINNVRARRRIALDAWSGFAAHLAPDVEAIVGDVADLSEIGDDEVDFAFASNLFEHVAQETFAESLAELRRVLTPAGSLTLLQPNYAYAYREYFDDYTHISVWSHVSIADFLAANGFRVETISPRFLPLTIKSRLPTHPLLIKAYLASPVKPLGKQMLVVARPA